MNHSRPGRGPFRFCQASSRGTFGPVLIALLGTFLAPALLAAQEDIAWNVPEASYEIDFRSRQAPAKQVFDQEGFCLQVPLNFAMLRRSKTAIQTQLPEPGRFEVLLTNEHAAVELRPKTKTPPNARRQQVDVVSTLSLKGPDKLQEEAISLAFDHLSDVRKQAQKEMKTRGMGFVKQYIRKLKLPIPADMEDQMRQAFVRHRTVELGSGPLLEKLHQFSNTHPMWINEREKSDWKGMPPQARFREYVTLLRWEMGEQYLEALDFELDATQPNYRNLVDAKVEAVYLLLTDRVDQSLDNRRVVSKSLTTEELARLRKMASVTLLCRFFPAVTKGDPNAQWFNGQRVACQADGIGAIRVEGRLDPSRHDHSDWWTLLNYNEGAVRFVPEKNPLCEFQLFTVGNDEARLRITATSDSIVRYSFHFRPTGSQGEQQSEKKGEKKVILHESESRTEPGFPY